MLVTLTETEKRYSQIEKEALAMVFGTIKFRSYLLGKSDVTAITDHKPLESIFKKDINKAPKRIQRMRLALQPYKLNVQYRKGKSLLISDHLSRSPLPQIDTKADKFNLSSFDVFTVQRENDIRESIELNSNARCHNITSKTLDKIKQETKDSETLTILSDVVLQGWPDDKRDVPEEAKPYWPYHDEITVQDGLIYRGTRVIIPVSLQQEMRKKAHATH